MELEMTDYDQQHGPSDVVESATDAATSPETLRDELDRRVNSFRLQQRLLQEEREHHYEKTVARIRRELRR